MLDQFMTVGFDAQDVPPADPFLDFAADVLLVLLEEVEHAAANYAPCRDPLAYFRLEPGWKFI